MSEAREKKNIMARDVTFCGIYIIDIAQSHHYPVYGQLVRLAYKKFMIIYYGEKNILQTYHCRIRLYYIIYI